MRLAIVISSAYEHSAQLARLYNAGADADAIGRRLGEADAKFSVRSLVADRSLPDRLSQLLQEYGSEIRALVVYFCGYAVFSEQRGTALLLDAPRVGAFSTARLAGVLTGVSAPKLALVDSVGVLDPGRSALDFGEDVSRELWSRARCSSIVAARGQEHASRSSAFASGVLLALDWLSSAGAEAVVARSLLDALRADLNVRRELGQVCAAGALDLELLPSVATPQWRPEPSSVRRNPRARAGAPPRAPAFSEERLRDLLERAPKPEPVEVEPLDDALETEPQATAEFVAGQATAEDPYDDATDVDSHVDAEEIERISADSLPSYADIQRTATGPAPSYTEIEPISEESLPSYADVERISADPLPSYADVEDDGAAPLPSYADVERISADPLPSYADVEDDGAAPLPSYADVERISADPLPSYADVEDDGAAPLPSFEAYDTARDQPNADAGHAAQASQVGSASEHRPRFSEGDPEEHTVPRFLLPTPTPGADVAAPDLDGLARLAKTGEPDLGAALDALSFKDRLAVARDRSDAHSQAPVPPTALPAVAKRSSSSGALPLPLPLPLPSSPSNRSPSLPPPPGAGPRSLPPPPGALHRSSSTPSPDRSASLPPPPGAPPRSLPPPPGAAERSAERSNPPFSAPVWTWQPPPAAEPNMHSARARGDELAARGDYAAAQQEYQRALALLGEKPSSAHAELYSRLGSVAAKTGQTDEALDFYQQALDIDPESSAALAGAAELLASSGDLEGAAELHQQRLELARSEEERRSALRALLQLWREHGPDWLRAREVLRQWIELEPADPEPLRELVAVEERLGDLAAAIAARVQLASAAATPAEKVELLCQAARATCDAQGDAEYAIGLAQHALALDAGAVEALEIASRLLVQQRDFTRLADLYDAVLARSPDGLTALELCHKLGRLSDFELRDPARAARVYERALAIDPSDVSLRLMLADVYAKLGDAAAAIAHCQTAIAQVPRTGAAYRKLHVLCEGFGLKDEAWNAACVLEWLGEADINESLAANTHRPEGLIAAQAVLSERDFAQMAFEREPAVDALLGFISAPALEVQLANVRKQKNLPNPDPAQRHDLEKSTITLGKSLLWTARLLSQPAPALFIVPDATLPIVSLPGAEPRILVSKSLASGLGLPELAFLWARHLSRYRPEHQLALVFDSPEQIGSLVRAAMLCAGVIGAEQATDDVRKLASSLRKRVSDASRLRDLASPLVGTDPAQRGLVWWRAFELSSLRLGLVACGDLHSAIDLLRRFGAGVRTTQEEQIEALLSFVISPQYTEIRRRLGVSVS